MHFTKSQIEEIARRLSILTKKDSEFDPATLPPDRTELVPIIEYIPLLQDYENRLLSLADLRSMVLENDDQSAIGCMLTINCSTPGVDVFIKGERRTTYTAHYGEMVDVVISAEGYDAWYGVITMTQSKTFNVVLNDKSSGPGPTPTTPFTVCVTGVKDIYGDSIEDASIRFTDSTGAHVVYIGEVRTYQSGESVRIDVTKEGYISYTNIVTSNFAGDITLNEQREEVPYLRFSNNTFQVPASGGTFGGVSVESNVSWVISVSSLPNPEEYDPSDAEELPELPESILMNEDDNYQLSNNMGKNKFTFKPKNTSIVSIDKDDVITGVSAGQTDMEVYDSDNTFRKNIPVTVTASGYAVEPTGIKLSKYNVTHYNSGWLGVTATVMPSNVTNNSVIWETSNPSVVIISSNGKPYCVGVNGTATVTAYTYDRKYSASCTVTVSVIGTVINKINNSKNPSISVSADGGTVNLKMDYTVYGGYDDGYTDFSNEYTWYNITHDGRETPKTVPLEIMENEGNARTFQIWFHGNEIDEEGVWLTVNQKGSQKCTLKYDTETCPSAGNTFGVVLTCAAGNSKNIRSAATVSDSWLQVDQSYLYIYSCSIDPSNNTYSSSNLLQYENTGKINGVDPEFNGVSVEVRLQVKALKNTTGVVRTGYVTFPGDQVLTVTQNG